MTAAAKPRLLSFAIREAPRPELVIRVGISSDYIASIVPGTLARFRERWPDVRFIVRTGYHDPLVRELRGGALDILVGISPALEPDALHSWAEEMVWVRGAATLIDQDRPVPLVTYGEPCGYHRLATAALKDAGLAWQDAFIGPSVASLSGALAAGFGVMAIMRRAAADVIGDKRARHLEELVDICTTLPEARVIAAQCRLEPVEQRLRPAS